MQRRPIPVFPTHFNLRVRDTRDAQIVFEAVRRGVLKSVSRRLNAAERSAFIQSGAIFVWEESHDKLVAERWVDGCKWNPSRMREPFLFYEEKVTNKASNDAIYRMRRRELLGFYDGTSGSTGSTSHLFDCTAHRPGGLIKQHFSDWVLDSPDSSPRRWHLMAYFTDADLQSLPTIDNDPTLRTITIPAGVYANYRSYASSSSTQ
ncbi:hypothetical protein BD410DRAFT_725210 [Rickenella mellea]|uniref:Gti1/Pac2 family-domain-containing protein n=1 Tax=Rickenella mellea TaxID=50990 RepID=A0A4Y7Q1X2_9AGAM|nr:hypothetical protein BD410DRAFT_725210 [Rickenella mellea]